MDVVKPHGPDIECRDMPGSPGWEVVKTEATVGYSIKFPVAKAKRTA